MKVTEKNILCVNTFPNKVFMSDVSVLYDFCKFWPRNKSPFTIRKPVKTKTKRKLDQSCLKTITE